MKILELINPIVARRYRSRFTQPKNVLAVSNTGLGDTLLSTPAIKTLKKSFPNVHITFMLQQFLYPLFEEYRYVDDFIFYKKDFFNQLPLVKEIRKRNIDTIFLFHSNGPEDIFFSILSRPKQILKHTYNTNYPFKQALLNTISMPNKHDIEARIDLVKLFKPKFIDTKLEISQKFYLPKKEMKKLRIGFQLGAQDRFKMWPIERFIELARRIKKKYQCELILFGNGNIESNLAKKFEQEIQCTNLCGKTDIEQLAFEVRNLDLLITNDTGTMHLAIALQTPTISLFAPTHYQLFGPYQDWHIHTIIQKDGAFVNHLPKKERSDEGMRLINVDEVFNATDKFIQKVYKGVKSV